MPQHMFKIFKKATENTEAYSETFKTFMTIQL